MKEVKHLIEEFHRGEWTPLMGKDKNGKKVQRYAKITEDEAESMNVYSKERAIRYVKEEAKTETNETKEEKSLEDIKKEYEVIAEKKPFHGWDAETLLEKIKEIKASKEA